jgi:hypothetical protein
LRGRLCVNARACAQTQQPRAADGKSSSTLHDRASDSDLMDKTSGSPAAAAGSP